MRGFRLLLWLMRVTGLARFELEAIDALVDEPGLVIAANHPTLLDALLVTSRLSRIVCITKPSIWDNPMLGAGARLAGYIRNDAPHRLVHRAAKAVRDGSQLLIFPEGTRTVTGAVGSFKPGFALMARQAGAPVQTVILEASSPYLRKGWPLLRRPGIPAGLSRQAGPPGPGGGSGAQLRRRAGERRPPGASPGVKHLVLMPSYNTGTGADPSRCRRHVRSLGPGRGSWCWMAATDGSAAALAAHALPDPGLRVLSLPRNLRQGGGDPARPASGGGGRGLHPCHHHGRGRSASRLP